MTSIVVHYQEIALKGKNRPWFIARLVNNIRHATSDLDVRAIRPLVGRLEVALGPTATYEQVAERLRRVFGIANFSKASRAPLDIDAIAAAILPDLGELNPRSFRVTVKRADKRFPMKSPEVEREIGGRIKLAKGWHVDLDKPELTISIEMLTSEAFYTFAKERGAGGLPTGVSGKVACLLSGGIDSPVAAWRMMRRGAVVVGLHFSGRPQTNDLSERLVAELGRVLERTGGLGRIYIVPFGDLQKEISLAAPPDLRVLLYRRLMVRVAEEVARAERAKALVTGESLGQVASQTLDNIAAVDEAATLPVLRPLIGNDKIEIIGEARTIGTYELSTQEHADCCTLFMPRSPETHARVSQVLEGEKDLDVPRMVADALASLTWVDFACASYHPPSEYREATGEPAPHGDSVPLDPKGPGSGMTSG